VTRPVDKYGNQGTLVIIVTEVWAGQLGFDSQ